MFHASLQIQLETKLENQNFERRNYYHIDDSAKGTLKKDCWTYSTAYKSPSNCKNNIILAELGYIDIIRSCLEVIFEKTFFHNWKMEKKFQFQFKRMTIAVSFIDAVEKFF